MEEETNGNTLGRNAAAPFACVNAVWTGKTNNQRMRRRVFQTALAFGTWPV
jgi:hypothetical protein